MTYKAFISYSHAADGKLAPAIQSAVQSFAKPWYKLRGIRVFRDETTLAMTPKLWPSIEMALDESEHFLLLASVESSRSKWVQREVEHWLQNKASDKLLIIVTGSLPLASEDTAVDFNWIRANLLPPTLASKLPQEEPLYLDLRWIRSEEHLSARNPRFLGEVAGLLATLTGRPKDELIGQDVREHRRLRRLAWSAIVVLTLLSVISTLAAVWATWQRDKAIARQWLGTSTLSQDDDPELSVLFASQAVAATWRWGHTVLPEAEEQLHRAILASHVRLTLRGHDFYVSSVAWSPDGSRLASGSDDFTAKIWDPQPDNELLMLRGANCLAWSPDGKRLATGSADKTTKIWDANTGTELLRLSGYDQPVVSVAWSPNGKRLATGSLDHTARVWDAETGMQMLTLRAHGDSVWSVAWSPDGKRLATGSDDHTAKLWNAEDGRELLTLKQHADRVMRVAWSPDGKQLATGSADKTAKIWDAHTGKNLLTVHGHSDWVHSVVWSPDGKRLATGSADKTAKIWDTDTGKDLLTLRGHNRGVRSVAWSPDGTRLATGSDDSTVKLWDAQTLPIHKAERNPQSVLRQSNRAGQHSDARFHRDAVLSRTDPFLLGSLFFRLMSLYLCADIIAEPSDCVRENRPTTAEIEVCHAFYIGGVSPFFVSCLSYGALRRYVRPGSEKDEPRSARKISIALPESECLAQAHCKTQD